MIEKSKKRHLISALYLYIAIMLAAPAFFMNTSLAEAGAGAENAVYLSQEEALAIALHAAEENKLISDEVNIVKISSVLSTSLDGDPRWYVNYQAEQLPRPYLLITLEATSGEVLDTSYENFRWYQKQWQAAKGRTCTWSLEDNVKFNQIYLDDERVPRLPQPGHISREEARDIALAVIKEEYALSDMQLVPYEIGYSLRDGIISGRSDACVWLIGFYDPQGETSRPVYQVNIEADTGKVILVYPDANSNG